MQLNLRIMNVFHSKSKSVWDRFVHSQTNSSNRRTDRQGHVGSQTTHATKILALFEPDIDSWQMWTRQSFGFLIHHVQTNLENSSLSAQEHKSTVIRILFPSENDHQLPRTSKTTLHVRCWLIVPERFSAKSLGSLSIGWDGRVYDRFPTPVHIVIHTSVVLPTTSAAALPLRRFQWCSLLCHEDYYSWKYNPDMELFNVTNTSP